MKTLDGLFLLTGVIFLLSIPVDAASNYRSSGDIIYQSRVGANSQSAREEKALLKDLTRYDPYMRDQFIPNFSGLTGGDSARSRTRIGDQMEKLESLNSGELTPEQYRTNLQDFVRSRESSPQIKKLYFKYSPSSQPQPVNPPQPADTAVKKTTDKEKKKSELKNPIDEYLDKLAEKQDKDKVKAAELKKTGDATKEEPKKSDVSTEKTPDISSGTAKPDEKATTAVTVKADDSNTKGSAGAVAK